MATTETETGTTLGARSSPSPTFHVVKCDILILGSGIAGLTCALEAAEAGTAKVVLVTKDELLEGSTRYAQGGVAAVMKAPTDAHAVKDRDKDKEEAVQDCVSYHMEDTMNAGCYLNDRKAVEIMCKEGPKQVEMLCQIGVPFTTLKKSESESESEKLLSSDESSKATSTALLHLGKEGGHSHPRVVHAADTTGAAIMKALVEKVEKHPSIEVYEHYFALDLLTRSAKVPNHSTHAKSTTTSSTTTSSSSSNSESEKAKERKETNKSEAEAACYGCDTVNLLRQGSYTRFVSKCTVIATGGCGQIYPKTTNPCVATGDGIAMAARVGATVENMEFVQFHPTSLYVDKEKQKEKDGDDNGSNSSDSDADSDADADANSFSSVFLISEAVRGAGAVLRNAKGEKFMKFYDARADLAPRDIVARGIYDQMRIHGSDHVYLDVTHLCKEQIEEEFPHISGHVKSVLGLNMSEDYVPVVPAQHYSCGGILTNTRGETDVRGLYAIGESACTGVHGANRLASNSLLEGLVFGKRAVASALRHMQTVESTDLYAVEHFPFHQMNSSLGLFPTTTKNIKTSSSSSSSSSSLQHQQALVDERTMKRLAKVKKLMWKYAGIRRNDKDLQTGLRKLRELKMQLQQEKEWEVETSTSSTRPIEARQVELWNMVDVAELVFHGAIKRKASAGLHWNVDRPEEKSVKPPRKMALF